MAAVVRTAGSPNYLKTETITIGATAVQVLHAEKNRAGYRVIAAAANTNNIWHDEDNRVSTASLDEILPGGVLADVGAWQTIYRGEVWLISDAAAQTVTVEEIVKQ